MVWTYCSACRLRTEWAASCSECGSANPLYRPSSPPQSFDETERAEMAGRAKKSGTSWHFWGFSAAYLLVFCVSLAVLVVLPPLFW